MNFTYSTIALFASIGFATATVQSQTLFDDTFDVGAGTLNNDADDPSDTLWSRRNASGLTYNAAVGLDTGGALASSGKSADLLITGSSTSAFADFYTRFPETSLEVGDTLTVTFTIRLYASPAIPNRSDQFRLVLGNTTSPGTAWNSVNSGSCYSFDFGSGTGSENPPATQFRFRSTSSVGGGAATGLGSHDQILINDTAAHTVTFSITRSSETENFLLFKLDDGIPVSVTTTLGITPAANGATLTAFDHLGILVMTTPVRYRLDNIKLEKTTFVPADTDEDGLDDTWEFQNFGSLTAQDGDGDPDGDGFTNLEEFLGGSNPNDPASTPLDLDADGLPDAWEIANFGSTAAQNGNGDPDGDLATNFEEYAAGTNPNDNTSWPDADSDTLNDAWEILYFGSISHPDAIPNADPDGDGFTNKQENDALSDPTNTLSVPGDFDGDGLPDAWEIFYFGNITSHTGAGDPDGDRATNAEEFAAGSNPTDRNSWPDADNDFINDAWEIFYFGSIDLYDTFSDPDGDGFNNDIEHTFGFDPTDPFSSPDLDGDGVADGWEVFWFDSIDTYDGTADIDGDGFNNIYEAAFRTDPTNPNSQPGDLDGDGISDGIILKPGGDIQPASSFVAIGANPPPSGWIDGLYPVAGQTYIVDGTGRGALRSPNLTGNNHTFAGDRLVIMNRSSLIWKHNGVLNVPLLELRGATIQQAIGGTNTVGTLNGDLVLVGTNPSTILASNGNFIINAPISGPSDLAINGNNVVTLNGALSLTGDIVVAAHYPTPETNRLILGNASNLTFNLGDGGATNTISGDGVITLNGAFSIDSAAVTNPSVGNSWTLLSTTGARTYGSTFSVQGHLSDNSTVGTRKWTSITAPYYQFDEASGALTILDSAVVDTDGDGVNDAWEILVFGDLSQTGDGDFDGDLVSNLDEFLAGTDPKDNTSWPDTDSDGLNDAWEILTFGNLTTATATDQDGDGLLDIWENFHFGSITAQNGSGDPDGDGFTNAQEFAARSNPNLAASTPIDTDGNGVADVNEKIKPYVVDSHTLHLWHLDDLVPPFTNAASPSHPLRGLLNGATGMSPAFGGFGNSVNTNSGVSPNFGIVSYAATLNDSTTGDTASPASPAFTWKGEDGAFTLEAIVKFDSLPSTWTTFGQIISMEGDGTLTQDRVFQLRIAPSGSQLQFVRLNGAIENVSVDLPLNGFHALDTSSWFHVAVTYDGNEDTPENMKFYWTKIVPGVTAANLLGSGKLTANFPAVVHGDFSIGNEARDTGGSTDNFRGSIDEVRISSIARAADGFLFDDTNIITAPSSLIATPGANSVSLSWSASSGASTYTIKRSTVSGGPYTTLSAGAVTDTTYTDNTAEVGTTYFYVVSAVGISESTNSNEVSAAATGGSDFQSWALSNGLTSGVNDGPTQDPDNDGIPNLLEYAFGGDPLGSTANPVATGVIINGSAQRVLRLSFPRVDDPALSYVVQASDNLVGGFTDVATYPAAATPVQHDDTVPLTSGVRRFLRVEIRQN